MSAQELGAPLKPHWIKLIDFVDKLKNGTIVVDFQDGLPVKFKIHEIKQEEFDLTK